MSVTNNSFSSKLDPLDAAVFDDSARAMISEAKQSELVLSRLRSRYHRNNIKGLIQLLTDSMFRCDIFGTASKMSDNGGKVSMYLYDEDLDFAQSLYPFYGAAHALELQPLFGRPYIKPTLYSDSERKLSSFLMWYWGEFAKG